MITGKCYHHLAGGMGAGAGSFDDAAPVAGLSCRRHCGWQRLQEAEGRWAMCHLPPPASSDCFPLTKPSLLPSTKSSAARKTPPPTMPVMQVEGKQCLEGIDICTPRTYGAMLVWSLCMCSEWQCFCKEDSF